MSLIIALLLPLGLLLIALAGAAAFYRAGRLDTAHARAGAHAGPGAHAGAGAHSGAGADAGAVARPGAGAHGMEPAGPRGRGRSRGRGGIVAWLRGGPVGRLSAPWRFMVVAAGALAVAWCVSAALGPVAVAAQPFDDWVYEGTLDHQIGFWKSFNEVITDVSTSWLVRGTCVGAVLMLTLVWRRHRWLPAAAMGAMLFASHYLVLGLTYLMDRPAPPNSGGTYPSGGNVRVVAVYGIVAFFFFLSARTSRRGRVIGWTILALLAWIEAYSRTYLAVHWVSDVIAGLVFGVLILVALNLATRAAIGDEDPAVDLSGPEPAHTYGQRAPQRATTGAAGPGAPAGLGAPGAPAALGAPGAPTGPGTPAGLGGPG
ncbi:phosphatase PAP2 family protein [Actinomadura sp. 9N215]|uniref:phosphatase PAP2 family protein n=1 Tax=Actinomadura sp. 9N215 TaxID=3375150 RepID=UPI00378DF4EC